MSPTDPAPFARSSSARIALALLLGGAWTLAACQPEERPPRLGEGRSPVREQAPSADDSRGEDDAPAADDGPGEQAPAADDAPGAPPAPQPRAAATADPGALRPPSPAEATRLAVARAALAEGEPVAALALVLGTPAGALTATRAAAELAAEATVAAADAARDPAADAAATGAATSWSGGGTGRAATPPSDPFAGLPTERPDPPSPTPGPPLGGAALSAILPQLPPALARLYAQALAQAGHQRSAALLWEDLARRLPALADRLWLEAGSAWFAMGDDAAALRAFDLVLAAQAAGPERAPDQRSLAQLRRGNALLRLGRAEEALAAYAAAELPAASAMARGQALAGAIAAQLAAGRPEEAAALRLRLLRELPDSELARTALGRLKEAGVAVPARDEARVLAAAGDPVAAAALTAEAPPPTAAPAAPEALLQAAREGDAGAWFKVGWLAWQAGQVALARSAWEEGAAALAAEGGQAARVAALHHWAGRAAAAAGDAAAAGRHQALAEAAAPLALYGLLARSLRQGGRLDAVDPLAAIAPEEAGAAQAGPSTGDGAKAGNAADGAGQVAPDLARAEAWLLLLEPEAAEQALAGSQERLKATGGRGDAAGLAALARAADSMELRTVTQLAGAAAIEAAAPRRLEDVDPRLLALAYPRRHHAAALQRAAREAGLPPELLLALVRQESRFREDAVSHLGALGLTQMMPDTGRQVAGWLGEADFDPPQLLDPYRSLRYGAAYLDWVLERYDGRLWPALAAYNAGPGQVDRWLAASGGEMDVFLETIDYPETAAYLRGTAVGLALYRWQAARP